MTREMMNTTLLLPVHEPTGAGAARRAAAEWAGLHGWDEQLQGRLALVVTELGRNLALHTTQGGALLLRRLDRGTRRGVEVMSLDSGPGMANFNQCLRDGHSTAGTPGTGLGAVNRVSEVFSYSTTPGVGTVLVSELWNQAEASGERERWTRGAVSVPIKGEILCGDQWAELSPRPEVLRMLLADGLGHGAFAAEAASKAVEVFTQHPRQSVEELLQSIHGALRSTRGAAVAIAEINLARREVTYGGIGNITASIVTAEKTSSLVSMNGTAGAAQPQVRSFVSPWPEGATLIMASDGLKSHWPWERYRSLLGRSASVLAGTLYRDQNRGRDDATVVVTQERP